MRARKYIRRNQSGKYSGLKCSGLLFMVLWGMLPWLQANPGFELPIVVAAGDTTDFTTKTVRVNLAGGSANSAKRIQLIIHNLQKIPEKSTAYLEINNGTERSGWIELSNSNPDVTVRDRERAYGGIGGGFHTVMMWLDLENLYKSNTTEKMKLSEVNTFRFILHKYAYDEGVSAYRVLYMRVSDAANKTILLGGKLPPTNSPGNASDAGDYIAANNTQSNRDAGEALWRSKVLQASPGKEDIRAKCMDCHTETGYDLKYFGYSNESIFKRSRFHGLDEDQAKKVTLYIRTLKDKEGITVPSYGRPWNPPYQPGKGLSDKSVKRWAAGAGHWRVLQTDEQMLPHVFPTNNTNGIVDRSDVESIFKLSQINSGYQPLNLIDIPIPLQLPDWNHWLPRVHPVDIWSDFKEVTGGGANPHAKYRLLASIIDGSNSTGRIEGIPYKFQLGNLHWSSSLFLREGATKSYITVGEEGREGKVAAGSRSNSFREASEGHTGRLKSDVLNGSSEPYRAAMHDEYAKRALTHWEGVKYFEIFHVGGLEDQMGTILNKPNLNGKGGWVPNSPTVFNNAPHKTARNARYWEGRTNSYDSSAPFELDADDQTPLEGAYASAVWYHLEAILNAGGNGVDWAYSYSYYQRLANHSGQAQAMMYAMTLIKDWQSRDIFMYREGNSTSGLGFNLGWDLRTRNPHTAFSSASGTSDVVADMDEYSVGLYKHFLNTSLKRWMQVVTHEDFPFTYSTDIMKNKLSEWRRQDIDKPATLGWNFLPAMDYEPSEWNGDYRKFKTSNSADSFWRLLPLLHQVGVDDQLLGDFKDWCKAAWPGLPASPNDWDSRIAKIGNYNGWYETHVQSGRTLRFQNVEYPSRYLRPTGGLGSQVEASKSRDWRTAWSILPAGGQWIYMERRGGLNIRGRLQLGLDGGGSLSPVAGDDAVGNIRKWRTLSLGDGKLRFQSKLRIQDDLNRSLKFLGTSANGEVRYDYFGINGSDSWKLVFPW